MGVRDLRAKKSYVNEDSPQCEFLTRNIKAERDAVEQYLSESSRSNDIVFKALFHFIASQEMEHLFVLEEIKKKLDCD